MWWLSKVQLAISVKDFAKSVLLPASIVIVVSCLLPSLIHFFMAGGWIRFVLVLAISLVSSAVSILYLGCAPSERKMLIELILGKLQMLRR